MFEETVCNVFPINPDYFIWLTYTSETGQVWYITSDRLRREYQLWHGKKLTARKAIDANELYKYIK